MSESYETDVEKLANLIHLEQKPQSVRWRIIEKGKSTSELPGPSDWAVIVLLEYDEQTLQLLKTQMSLPVEGELQVEMEFFRNWFPEEVRNSFVHASNSTYLTLAQPRYQPTTFARSPLDNGYVFFVGDWIFLSLYTL